MWESYKELVDTESLENGHNATSSKRPPPSQPCPACSRPIGKGAKALSYGAYACLSCRAFFRRKHQDLSRSSRLRCLYEGDCARSTGGGSGGGRPGRRRCARCRLDACLRAGMMPGLVLTPQEREARFKRAKDKKTSRATKGRQTGKTERNCEDEQSTPEETTFEYVSPAVLEVKEEEKPFAEAEIDDQGDAAYQASANLVLERQFASNDSAEPPTDRTRNVYSTTSTVASSVNNNSPLTSPKSMHFELRNQTIELEQSDERRELDINQLKSELVEEIFPPHQPRDDKSLCNIKQSLLHVFKRLFAQFEEMAATLNIRFTNRDDWAALLGQNKRLYLNYIFARCLLDERRILQNCWMFPTSDGERSTPEDVFQKWGLFGGDEVLQKAYCGYARTLSNTTIIINPQSKSLLAQALFYYKGGLDLANPAGTWQEFLRHLAMLDQQASARSFLDLCQTLEAMAVLFEHSGLVDQLPEYSQRHINDATPPIGFTGEEELWLSMRSSSVTSAMAEAEVSAEVATEAEEFALQGRPLSPNFARGFSLCFRERVLRFFAAHDEFLGLPDGNRRHLVRSCQAAFWAMSTARLHGVPMCEQVAANHSDREVRGQKALGRIVGGRSPRPIRVRDVFPSVPLRIEEELIPRVQPLLRRGGDCFFAVMALALTSMIPTDGYSSPMTSLAMQYQLVISRKFYQMGMLEEIQSVVADVQTIAHLMHTSAILPNTYF